MYELRRVIVGDTHVTNIVCVTKLVTDIIVNWVKRKAEAVTVCVTSGAFVHAVSAAGVLCPRVSKSLARYLSW